MSLNGALHIGRTGLMASQAALQVAGNNMANAATKGYARRSVHLAPMRGEAIASGQYIGRGVEILSIRREVDVALQARHRDAISQEHASLLDQRFLTTIETLQNELTDNDISSLLSAFFNSFSELANNPEDNAVRSVVIQQGVNLSSRLADLRRDYSVVVDEIDQSLGASIDEVNNLLDRIALLNREISTTEFGEIQANALCDQRDLLIDEVAEFMDVTVIEQASGSADLLVGSIPVVLGTESRGIELRKKSVGDEVEVSIRVAADGSDLAIRSGALGGLLRQREGSVQPVLDDLDTFAAKLIYEVNRLHSQGQGRSGLTSVTGTYSNLDATANLNAVATDLPFRVENGSFIINMTHAESDTRTSYQINVDGDAMSLDDLIAEINTVVGVSNLTAGKDIANRLTLTSDAGYEISFSEDSSGVLAALGLNTFFNGQDAASIEVNQLLRDDPNLLAAGAGHVRGSNETALAIANLQDVEIADLGHQSLREFWQNGVNALAVKTNAASAAVESSRLVRESLNGQMQAVSGVSLDEESINLLTFQRQFQAAARFIAVIDETIQTLLSIA